MQHGGDYCRIALPQVFGIEFVILAQVEDERGLVNEGGIIDADPGRIDAALERRRRLSRP